MTLLPDSGAHLTHMREQVDRYTEARRTGDRAACRDAAARATLAAAALDAHMSAGGAPPVQWLEALPAEAFPPSVKGYYVPADGRTQ